ncbi:MAG: ribosomal biogenesis protein [Candidatus Thermoplasmatota archaeon]|nr:ribosomal biogenesis protein [Euryarchaeota archaeon]MBU4032518.1 ribosomal biogenesis protein [Candidatus Thermoplasmatota archaeon]MBU4071225.1 ribosomal biogenesis protein [Candidatus Thermoplasmatota archaeon]MBU4143980.1 ribosomal biogenesis protein [Candidatus Thermoplasmatota archaeon]MBU4591411.1 ribosomal biogenesis protein [Candidatus Thermoplasmatota archaeon]
MKLVTTWFGTFILDDGDNILEKTLFPADPEEIAKRLQSMEAGEILPEEEGLADGRPMLVREKRLAILGDVLDFEQPDIRPDDFDIDRTLLGKAMLSKGREKVKASTRPDEHIVQAIRTIDDLTKIANLMSERLHEWHELNFPELTAMVPEAKYVELIAEYGDRAAILDSGKVDIAESMGADVSEADARAMQSLAANILTVIKEKEAIEKYIGQRMKEIAPNLTHLAGPLVGARLISLTGGMDRLSKLPSSTIQLLGAEKALFKHLKDNARPPKHGVIFQHPLIHRSPPWQRGKIARVLAAKLGMAIKIDMYGDGRFVGPELEAALSKRVEEIRKKHPKPKPRAKPHGKNRHKR